MEHLIAPTVNFLIFVGLLAFLLPPKVRAFVTSRHAFIRDEVLRIQEQLRGSKSRFDDFSAKLKAVDTEVAAIRAQTLQEAETARVRIASDAKRLAGQIVTDARLSADALMGDVRQQMRAEMVSRVIARAEAILRQRLTGDDRARIRREFSRQVESIQ